jgi:FkbM family methyltransferase
MKQLIKSMARSMGYEIRRLPVAAIPSVAHAQAQPSAPTLARLAPVAGKVSRVLAVNTALASLIKANGVIEWETVLEVTYRKFLTPGQTVLDVGAHAGLHARVFLECVGPNGRVHAFEPLPHLAEALAKQFADRPHFSITAAALSRTPGTSTFKFARNAPQESGLKERIYNRPNPDVVDISVTVDMLDAYAERFDKIDYIKMDIEGGEMDALAGATRLLQKHRPILSVEYGHPGYSKYNNTKFSLFDFAAEQRFVLADIFGNLIRTREEWDIVCDSVYWDFLLLPAERAEVIEAQLVAGG